MAARSSLICSGFERRRGDPPNLLLYLLRGEQQGFGRFAVALGHPIVLDIHPVQADEDDHVEEVGIGVGTGNDGQHIVGDGDAAPQQGAPRGGLTVFLL